eukprot:239904-Hanusia_phi.AAC.2
MSTDWDHFRLTVPRWLRPPCQEGPTQRCQVRILIVRFAAEPLMPGIPDTIMRSAGGKKWSDASLLEWPKDDYRMFCGNLGNEVMNEEECVCMSNKCSFALIGGRFNLGQMFRKVFVISKSQSCERWSYKQVKDPADFTRAMKEMQGKYVGNRPVKLMKSEWQGENSSSRLGCLILSIVERALQPGTKRPKPQPQQEEEEEDVEWWKKKAKKPNKK